MIFTTWIIGSNILELLYRISFGAKEYYRKKKARKAALIRFRAAIREKLKK